MRAPYVVQERVEPVRSIFPLMSFGHLEFREMQVDVHPHAYLGKVQGCSSWLSSGQAGFSSAAGIVPTFILDPNAYRAAASKVFATSTTRVRAA